MSMGNVTLFNSICGECSIKENNEENKSKSDNNLKLKIDQILIKEISERERMVHEITTELSNLKNSIDQSLDNIKQFCTNEKNLLEINLVHVEANTNSSISDIKKKVETIKEKHLFDIEKDMNIVKTTIDNQNEDIKEIKNSLKEITRHVIKNTTQLELLNRK